MKHYKGYSERNEQEDYDLLNRQEVYVDDEEEIIVEAPKIPREIMEVQPRETEEAEEVEEREEAAEETEKSEEESRYPTMCINCPQRDTCHGGQSYTGGNSISGTNTIDLSQLPFKIPKIDWLTNLYDKYIDNILSGITIYKEGAGEDVKSV